MYGFGDQLDWAIFTGSKIESVCFSINTISITFNENVSIDIVGEVHLQLLPSGPRIVETVGIGYSALPAFVGRTVLNTALVAERCLTLTFEGGVQISLLDDSDEFKSFIFQIAAERFFV